MGRLVLGPDHRFATWEGTIWSQECSQRLADPYSFSHISHGLLFYAMLWLVARQWPVHGRFAIASLLEGGWEILENSPIIINRYREVTLALGYEGDSIVNSLSDILMMVGGFYFAHRLPPWASVALFIGMEVACLVFIRDNLTLNVLMLLYPVQAIKRWQMAIRPPLP
jgi:hypothetical protein